MPTYPSTSSYPTHRPLFSTTPPPPPTTTNITHPTTSDTYHTRPPPKVPSISSLEGFVLRKLPANRKPRIGSIGQQCLDLARFFCHVSREAGSRDKGLVGPADPVTVAGLMREEFPKGGGEQRSGLKDDV